MEKNMDTNFDFNKTGKFNFDQVGKRMQGFETEHLVVLVYSIELDYFFHKRTC